MNAVTTWLAAHKISSHTIVLVLGAFTAAYEADPTIQAAVKAFLSAHPHLAVWAGFASSVYFIYQKSQKALPAPPEEQPAAKSASA